MLAMSQVQPSPLHLDVSPPGSDSSDRVRWIRGAEALEADVIKVLSRPVMGGRFWVDLENARRWIEERRATREGDELTYTHLFVKAAGMAVMASPNLHRMYGVLRCLEPAAADVGVSVAAEGALAPVVVLPAADRMSVDDIARELRERAARARAEDPRTRTLIDRFVYVVPLPFLRRLLVRLVFSNARLRRKLVGTIQLTNVGFTGADDCYVSMVGELLLGCGIVEKRVLVDENDRPCVRTGAVFTLQGSHRKLTGLTGRPFVARFRELLAAPQQLAERVAD
jgi:pyruvate/2-oxoglutarate dehydrogenase complex dihydrolipoamide acyltransferase (E2) component